MLDDKETDEAIEALADVVLRRAVDDAAKDAEAKGKSVDYDVAEKIRVKLRESLVDHLEESLLVWIYRGATPILAQAAAEVYFQIIKEHEEKEETDASESD